MSSHPLLSLLPDEPAFFPSLRLCPPRVFAPPPPLTVVRVALRAEGGSRFNLNIDFLDTNPKQAPHNPGCAISSPSSSIPQPPQQPRMRECLSNALAAWSEGDYATAIKEYLKNLIMASEQERMSRYQQQFSKLLVEASRHGYHFEDKNHRLQNDLFAKSPLVLWQLGNLMLERDPLRSLSLYKQAGTLSGGLDLVNVLSSVQTARTTVVSTWHISMINDLIRNFKFNQALSKIVSLDSRVIDIGAGTGLLSMYAARYSRYPVVGLEGEKPMAQLGAQCVIANGLQGRVLIYPMMSSQFLPAVKPDVVVSETMDAGGLGEKILQIFHDAHVRYRLDDPEHKITFCPSKLSFSVVVVQSDKFWRTRMHAHNCQTLGCADTCWLRPHGHCLLSDHDMIRSFETDYTTIDTGDYADLIYLTDHVEIFDTPLDKLEFLEQLKEAQITMKDFTLPITNAGRADAVLLCWKATFAEGIELESVRKGGWDYAAYPLQARTHYNDGDTFHGEYVIHFEQGITINHIVDPATTPGRKESMVAGYDKCLRKKDDGVIELVNNESLMKFLSPVPSRHSHWLKHGLDAYFPITAEGILQYKYLERCANEREDEEHLEFDTIFSVRAYGALFKAGHIHHCARQDARAQLGVDLRTLDEFSLREYREVRGVNHGRVTLLSTPTLMIDLDPRREYEPIVTGEQAEVDVIDTSMADGILYWWVLNGTWSNLEADLPLAAFLFDKRERVQQGTKFGFNVFMKESEFFISYGDGRIAASPEDAALAAPAAAAPPIHHHFPPQAYYAGSARTTDV